MDSTNSAPIRSRFDRWKMESFSNNSRHSNYNYDRRRSASSNRSNASTRSDVKNGDNYGCAFHGYNKYSALWNRSAKCIVCMSFVTKLVCVSFTLLKKGPKGSTSIHRTRFVLFIPVFLF